VKQERIFQTSMEPEYSSSVRTVFLRTHAEEEEEEPTHTHICIQGIPPPPIKFQFHLGLVRTEGFCIISSPLIRAQPQQITRMMGRRDERRRHSFLINKTFPR
jgi:hypothetical protein